MSPFLSFAFIFLILTYTLIIYMIGTLAEFKMYQYFKCSQYSITMCPTVDIGSAASCLYGYGLADYLRHDALLCILSFTFDTWHYSADVRCKQNQTQKMVSC